MITAPLYLAIVALIAAAYIDKNLWRVLVYGILINLAIVSTNAEAGYMSVASFAIFSIVLFPALMYMTIRKTSHEDERKGFLNFAALFSLPALYVFLALRGFGDTVPLYVIFLFSIACLATIRNAVRLLFFMYILENAVLLLSNLIFGAFTEGLAPALTIDFVAFLPVALMAYLTVRLYKENGSLDIWQIWQS